jgi:hypothetical protein
MTSKETQFQKKQQKTCLLLKRRIGQDPNSFFELSVWQLPQWLWDRYSGYCLSSVQYFQRCRLLFTRAAALVEYCSSKLPYHRNRGFYTHSTGSHLCLYFVLSWVVGELLITDTISCQAHDGALLVTRKRSPEILLLEGTFCEWLIICCGSHGTQLATVRCSSSLFDFKQEQRVCHSEGPHGIS